MLLHRPVNPVQGKEHKDPRAFAFHALDADVSPMLPDDCVDEVQSHAGAGDRTDIAGAVIALTHALNFVRWYADATILDDNLGLTVALAGVQRHDRPIGRVFDGIFQ